MKYKLMLLFVLILLGFSTVQTQTKTGNKTIELQARDYLQAIVKEDGQKILNYTNPEFVRELGGRLKALKFINKELKEMRAMLKLVSAEITETKTKQTSAGSESRIYIKAKFSSPLFGDEGVEQNGFLKPVSMNKATYFLHEKGIICSFYMEQCAIEEEEEKTTGFGSGVGRGAGAGNDGLGSSKSTEKDDPPSTGKVVFKIRKSVKPEYTQEARDANFQGTILLRLSIDKEGNVLDAKPINGLPYGLTEKAVEAALQIKFDPPMRNGKAVSSATTTVELKFSL